MKRIWKVFVVVCLWTVVLAAQPAGAQSLSNGVYYETKKVDGRHFEQMSINLDKPYTTVDMLVPSPINSLKTVSALAKGATREQYHVVGAMNASFFHFNNGLPGYLLVKDGKIAHLGSVSSNRNDFMHTPAAFGVKANGEAQIAPYTLTPTIHYNGQSYAMKHYNKERSDNDSVLFTSSWAYSHTRTNQFGIEVVVSTSRSAEQNIALGERVKGKITGIRPYGQKTSAAIPTNGRGFVISVHGSEIPQFVRSMQKGEEVELSYTVDERWQDANFMLASGPLLVQNGRPNLTIDTSSDRSKQVTDRSAVGVTADGKRVMFVTVGRQNGGKGMTLPQFANYLSKLGLAQAINLDGGGSTTMVHRPVGHQYPDASSRPGRERSVHAVLAAVSTAPYGEPKYAKLEQAQQGALAVGSSVGYRASAMMDEYLNVLPQQTATATPVEVRGGVGEIRDNQFVATRAGKGSVVVEYGGVRQEVPVEVVNPTALKFSSNELTLAPGKTATLTVDFTMPSGKPVIVNNETIEMIVPAELGTWENGRFTAALTEGVGEITAKFGTVQKKLKVIITNTPQLVGSFESTNGLVFRATNATGKLTTNTKQSAYDRQGSVQLDYQFEKNGTTSAAYMDWQTGYPMQGNFEAIGVAIYGNGGNHWVRGQVKDANGKIHSIDFTEPKGLNWHGWKRVKATLPNSIAQPALLESIYVVETDGANKKNGSVRFDELILYPNATETLPRTWSSSAVTMTVPGDKVFNVRFTQPMNMATLTDAKYTYIENRDGTRYPVRLVKQDERTVGVQAVTTLPAGEYSLVITATVTNAKGKPMKDDHVLYFKVNS